MIGHAAAQAWLRRALETDRLAHAYLITGPRAVGKRTFALEIAQALNCKAAAVADRPDHTCQQCSMIQRGIHPDVRVVRRAPERRMISLRPPASSGPPRDYVDNVQFIQSDAQLRPVMGRRKVYVILYAEELAEDAGNRLLKTLEEPPPFVLFLLTAIERGGVLPTIASRCQELRLRPAGRAQLADALVAEGMEPERAGQLAALAGGRQGWALAAAREPALVEQQQTYARQLVDALSGSRLDRLVRARALSERWAMHPETVRDTLRVWMSWWRDVVLVQLGLTGRVVHLEAGEQSTLQAAAGRVSRQAAREAAAAIQQTLADLDTNVNARLALDLLLLRLPTIA
ncbi:MAG: DNA polymerase III subunit delta' [Chloroflexi bacterium]|nr:DNA polymerase III subunit delta' [Chloroflexota bacterium]